MRPDSKARKVARGRVWVRPGRLPAKVMVAPNSPKARAHESAKPDKTAGRASGKVMLPNTRQLLAPSVRATSASFGVALADAGLNADDRRTAKPRKRQPPQPLQL